MFQALFIRHRADLHAASFELIGTALFLLFSFTGCQTAATIHQTEVSDPSAPASVDQIAYCANSFGLSLLTTISVFFRVTGGVFNPAVSFALFITGGLTLVRFVLYCLAQLVGSIVAAYLLQALHPGPTSVNTTLNPAVSSARGVFIEAFTTFLLVITVLVTATDKRTIGSKILAPLTIAASLWLGHIWSIEYTGAGINPARSFGPSVAEGFHSDHWIYWVGPLIGSTVAVALFKYLHFTEYWVFGNCYDAETSPLLPVFTEKATSLESPSGTAADVHLPILDHSAVQTPGSIEERKMLV